ncbi:hypothetical protein K461DRAFT_322782 [Myriangium duriaei CBS 260.36]|uniref:RING-type domain-containing protein n=1 Tax=Myriangium duriaei CBS 260.36 TaxID=1168546 RepID=A0A9P4MHS4_9PEZI|nr:hypothetical protein K461DRAFT_322782 [Myriangium duriaei CBS 260.36]
MSTTFYRSLDSGTHDSGYRSPYLPTYPGMQHMPSTSAHFDSPGSWPAPRCPPPAQLHNSFTRDSLSPRQLLSDSNRQSLSLTIDPLLPQTPVSPTIRIDDFSPRYGAPRQPLGPPHALYLDTARDRLVPPSRDVFSTRVDETSLPEFVDQARFPGDTNGRPFRAATDRLRHRARMWFSPLQSFHGESYVMEHGTLANFIAQLPDPDFQHPSLVSILSMSKKAEQDCFESLLGDRRHSIYRTHETSLTVDLVMDPHTISSPEPIFYATCLISDELLLGSPPTEKGPAFDLLDRDNVTRVGFAPRHNPKATQECILDSVYGPTLYHSSRTIILATENTLNAKHEAVKTLFKMTSRYRNEKRRFDLPSVLIFLAVPDENIWKGTWNNETATSNFLADMQAMVEHEDCEDNFREAAGHQTGTGNNGEAKAWLDRHYHHFRVVQYPESRTHHQRSPQMASFRAEVENSLNKVLSSFGHPQTASSHHQAIREYLKHRCDNANRAADKIPSSLRQETDLKAFEKHAALALQHTFSLTLIQGDQREPMLAQIAMVFVTGALINVIGLHCSQGVLNRFSEFVGMAKKAMKKHVTSALPCAFMQGSRSCVLPHHGHGGRHEDTDGPLGDGSFQRQLSIEQAEGFLDMRMYQECSVLSSQLLPIFLESEWRAGTGQNIDLKRVAQDAISVHVRSLKALALLLTHSALDNISAQSCIYCFAGTPDSEVNFACGHNMCRNCVDFLRGFGRADLVTECPLHSFTAKDHIPYRPTHPSEVSDARTHLPAQDVAASQAMSPYLDSIGDTPSDPEVPIPNTNASLAALQRASPHEMVSHQNHSESSGAGGAVRLSVNPGAGHIPSRSIGVHEQIPSHVSKTIARRSVQEHQVSRPARPPRRTALERGLIRTLILLLDEERQDHSTEHMPTEQDYHSFTPSVEPYHRYSVQHTNPFLSLPGVEWDMTTNSSESPHPSSTTQGSFSFPPFSGTESSMPPGPVAGPSYDYVTQPPAAPLAFSGAERNVPASPMTGPSHIHPRRTTASPPVFHTPDWSMAPAPSDVSQYPYPAAFRMPSFSDNVSPFTPSPPSGSWPHGSAGWRM